MTRIQQWEDPEIELLESVSGEVTLSIDGEQAMQGWERDLMWASADMLCTFGHDFLEVGLGLGISALRIAGNPNTRTHTVVERYNRVIELFRDRNPGPPSSLHIVKDDAFQYFARVRTTNLDGIFFDPFMPASIENQQSLWDEFMPLVINSLRPGGAFIPFFTTEPILKWPFFHYFDQIIVRKLSYTAYPETNYTRGQSGTAYIQCFIKRSA
jgi:spermidine synthase